MTSVEEDEHRNGMATSPATFVNKYGFITSKQAAEEKESRDKVEERCMKWKKMIPNFNDKRINGTSRGELATQKQRAVLWEEFLRKNKDKVKERCRKGIPSAIRSDAWYFITSAYKMRYLVTDGTDLLTIESGMSSPDIANVEFLYSSYVAAELPERTKTEITNDIHRQFADHELFKTRSKYNGQNKLFNVLKAYAIHNPKVGYCQAQAPIAAVLLMFQDEENAFWTFERICCIHLNGYFDEGLGQVQTDLAIFVCLMYKKCRHVFKFLRKATIYPSEFAVSWFMCAFIRVEWGEHWNTLLRIFDQFVFEGVKVIFKAALTMMELLFAHTNIAKVDEDEARRLIQHPPSSVLNSNVFLKHMANINLEQDELVTAHLFVDKHSVNDILTFQKVS